MGAGATMVAFVALLCNTQSDTVENPNMNIGFSRLARVDTLRGAPYVARANAAPRCGSKWGQVPGPDTTICHARP